MKINSNHCNRAFNREIGNCWNWLRNEVFDVSGYPSRVLLDRMVQLVAEIGHYPFALAVSTLCKSGGNCLPLPGTKINCNKAFMEVGLGRVTVTLKQWLSNQLNFLLHWGYCFVAILSIKKTSANNLPAVLIFGVGEEDLFKDGNDERFVSFSRLGPVEPLRNGKRFIVQSSAKLVSSAQSDFTYSKNPLICLLREANLGFLGRSELLLKHTILFFTYAFAAFRLPQLSLLGKEFSYSRISFELDKRELIGSIILTCSWYTSQPIWVRELTRSKVHMIWYAQNWRPIAYSADSVVADLPQLRWIRVDEHWVWTHAFADYLRFQGIEGVNVVGPIVWDLPVILEPGKDVIEILIFDTPAFSDEVSLRAGEIPNYYRKENLQKFIQDVLSLSNRLESVFRCSVHVSLKTKRGYNPCYDLDYFKFLEKLDLAGVLSSIASSTNIYSCVSKSHLVIAYPFSSAGYISEALGVPAIYYDPTKSVLSQDFRDKPSSIGFANCPQDLIDSAICALKNSFIARCV